VLTQGEQLPPLTVALLAAGETFAYQPFVSPPPGVPGLPSRLVTFTAEQQETIRRQLAALGAGAEALVQVKVEPADAFRQTLTFALRLADPDATPLPLDPYTIHFEDPEYNRALATQAGPDPAADQADQAQRPQPVRPIHGHAGHRPPRVQPVLAAGAALRLG
jgi:hypothetical protein